MSQTILQKSQDIVNRLPETERIIALVLMFVPAVLSLVDTGGFGELRPSISNYAYMCHSYWFGSLLALAGALFIFNGAQHINANRYKQSHGFSDEQMQNMRNNYEHPERFGRGYNIWFGLALFGVIYFDHLSFLVMHYIMAVIFFGGCIIMMVWKPRPEIKRWGQVLGILGAIALVVHFVLEYWLLKDNNPYTLLWAEWIGMVCIAIYFIKDSLCYAPILKTTVVN